LQGAYPEEAIVQQLVGLLSWGNNVVLITKISEKELETCRRIWRIKLF
jgi:hypothetical protein